MLREMLEMILARRRMPGYLRGIEMTVEMRLEERLLTGTQMVAKQMVAMRTVVRPLAAKQMARRPLAQSLLAQSLLAGKLLPAVLQYLVRRTRMPIERWPGVEVELERRRRAKRLRQQASSRQRLAGSQRRRGQREQQRMRAAVMMLAAVMLAAAVGLPVIAAMIPVRAATVPTGCSVALMPLVRSRWVRQGSMVLAPLRWVLVMMMLQRERWRMLR